MGGKCSRPCCGDKGAQYQTINADPGEAAPIGSARAASASSARGDTTPGKHGHDVGGATAPEGQPRQGKKPKSGYGKWTYSNGSSYEGQWCMEVPEGHGIERLQDGSWFEGQFHNGDKSGQGKFTWNTGGFYEGDFNGNDMHGEGFYQWSDGRTYRGQWERNHSGPRGVMEWNDGRRYEGEVLTGKKHGEGMLKWRDGRSYSGQWQSDRQHGIGIAVTSQMRLQRDMAGTKTDEGLCRKSQWEHGHFVRWLDDAPEAGDP